jgi:hypothetical protein
MWFCANDAHINRLLLGQGGINMSVIVMRSMFVICVVMCVVFTLEHKRIRRMKNK